MSGVESHRVQIPQGAPHFQELLLGAFDGSGRCGPPVHGKLHFFCMLEREGQKEESSRLLQTERREFFENRLASGPWVTVYRHEPGPDFFDFFSALVPSQFVKGAMSKLEWDLLIGDGGPGFTTCYAPRGPAGTRYFRFGNDEGIFPFRPPRAY